MEIFLFIILIIVGLMLHTKFRADKSKREIVSELVKLGHSYEYAEAIF